MQKNFRKLYECLILYDSIIYVLKLRLFNKESFCSMIGLTAELFELTKSTKITINKSLSAVGKS